MREDGRTINHESYRSFLPQDRSQWFLMNFGNMSEDERIRLVRQWMHEEGFQIGSIEGVDDPDSFFIHLHEQHPEVKSPLSSATTALVIQWSEQADEAICTEVRGLENLLYTTARIGAIEAIPAVAKLAGRDSLAAIPRYFQANQDMQDYTLWILEGLLLQAPAQVRDAHRDLFENALNTHAHALRGFTALSRFYPDEQPGFLERLRRYQDPVLEVQSESFCEVEAIRHKK